MLALLIPICISTFIYIRFMLSDSKHNRESLVYAVWLSFATGILSTICQYAAGMSLGETNKTLVKVTSATNSGNVDGKVMAR